KSAGVAVPQSVLLHEAQWKSDAKAIGFSPVVVKRPSSEHLLFDEKAEFCATRQELEAFLERLANSNDGGGNLLVQEEIQGVRHNCRFVAVGGKLLGYLEQVVLSTDRINGSGYGVEGI